MSLLDAEQSARYIDSLVASVQALEADLAATREKLRELERENAEADELLRVGLQVNEQAQARIAALEAERDSARHFIEQWFAIRNEPPPEIARIVRGDLEKLDACAPYLQESETPAQCLERHRKDIDALLELMQQDKARIAALEQPVFIERLAEWDHSAWAGWTRYMLERLTPENISRWRRQCDTPYCELSEAEKESDRKEAREILALVQAQADARGREE